MFNYTLSGLCARPSIYLLLHTIIIIIVVVAAVVFSFFFFCASRALRIISILYYFLLFDLLLFSCLSLLFVRSVCAVCMSIDHDRFSHAKRILSVA